MRKLGITLVVVAALGIGTLGLAARAGGSVLATSNPCKLLKRAEISRVLGQPVAKANKGRDLQALVTCSWRVSAAGSFPDGEIDTLIQSVGAKIAFDTNSEGSNATPIPGLSKSFYDSALGTVNLLRGDLFMSVQAVFIATEGGVSNVERKDELIKLAKIAAKRLG